LISGGHLPNPIQNKPSFSYLQSHGFNVN